MQAVFSCVTPLVLCHHGMARLRCPDSDGPRFRSRLGTGPTKRQLLEPLFLLVPLPFSIRVEAISSLVVALMDFAHA